MARRKEFKLIADGLVGSFISRNNDVYGYWGIGKLYSYMISTGNMKLKIDLINKSMLPENEEFKLLINEFSNRLNNKIKSRGLNHDFLKNAELTIIGNPNEPTLYFGRMAPNKVTCSLKITDDLNREHLSEASTWCREHDPEKELKSSREYK